MTGRPTKLTPALNRKIIAALKTGATIADACQYVGIAESTFYDWKQRGENGEPVFAEFSEKVLRAQANAKVTAIKTLYVAGQPFDQTRETTKTFTETRKSAYGEPYDYTETTYSKEVSHMQGDWRASEAYLKRRHFAEWGDQSKNINFNVDSGLAAKLMQAFEARGLSASEVFEAMLTELSSVDSAAGSTGDSN